MVGRSVKQRKHVGVDAADELHCLTLRDSKLPGGRSPSCHGWPSAAEIPEKLEVKVRLDMLQGVVC